MYSHWPRDGGGEARIPVSQETPRLGAHAPPRPAPRAGGCTSADLPPPLPAELSASPAASPRPGLHGDMAGGHHLLLENARQVVLVCTRGERFLAGDALRSLEVLEGASLVVGT